MHPVSCLPAVEKSITLVMRKRKRSSGDVAGKSELISSDVGNVESSRGHQGDHSRRAKASDGEDPEQDMEEVAPKQEEAQPQQPQKRKRKRTRNKKGGLKLGGGSQQGESGVGEAVQADRNAPGAQKRGAGDGSGEFITGLDDTIYVEGIPHTCDESDLCDFFKGCGEITAIRMPRWHDSGRARGYAHVCFADAQGARAAFDLDGQYLNERYLTIKKPQEPATGKLRRAYRGAQQPPGCRTVFIKNLPYDADEDSVSEALSGCGKIASVRLAMWNHTKKLKGFGYVEFVTERGAEACVRTQEALSVGGRPIVVDFETGAPKGSFRRQDGAQIQKKSADAGVGKGIGPMFKGRWKGNS